MMFDGMKPGMGGDGDDKYQQAIAMRDRGLPIEQIASALGMSVEEVQALFDQQDGVDTGSM